MTISGVGLAWISNWALEPLTRATLAALAGLDRQVLLVGMGLSTWLIAYGLHQRKRWFDGLTRARHDNELARFLMTEAELGEGNGVILLTAHTRILALSSLPLRLATDARPDAPYPTGLCLEQVYAPRLAQFLHQLLNQALVARKAAVADIVDWAIYCDRPLGPVRVTAVPAYDASSYRGALLIFRNLAELHLLQDSAQGVQQTWEVLFDSLPLAAAIYKPVPGPVPGTTEALLQESNAPFRQLFEGLYEGPTTLADFLRSQFVRVPQLRDAMARLLTQGERVRVEFFSTSLGKYVDVTLAQLPGERVLILTLDRTEQQLYAEQVLRLNDQLRLTVGRQSDRMAALQEDRDRFIEAVADQVVNCLARAVTVSRLEQTGESIPLDDALRSLAGQLLDYSATASLPYEQSGLVDTRELLQRLVAPRRQARADLDWELGELPHLMASPVVLEDLLNRLLDRLERLPRQDEATLPRIAISGYSQFLKAGLRVSGFWLDARELFVDLPETAQDLDWTICSDLALATVRRIIATHGGRLAVRAEAGGGFSLLLTLGTPD